MLLALSGMRALLAPRRLVPSNPMLVLGRASLVVYWVHVELAYGNFSYPLHKAMSTGWALTGYAVVTLGMYFLAVGWLRRPGNRPLIPAHMVASASPVGRVANGSGTPAPTSRPVLAGR
jgi:hypothetical protein